MAANAVPITLEQMDTLLAPLGFSTITLTGTRETVFARPYRRVLLDESHIPLSIRVYTSIVDGHSRGVGEDAIRVSVVANVNGRIVGLGSDKRVHRVENWRSNLLQRLARWEEVLEPYCPRCGAPTRLCEPKNGATWKAFRGCIRYPDCKGTIV